MLDISQNMCKILGRICVSYQVKNMLDDMQIDNMLDDMQIDNMLDIMQVEYIVRYRVGRIMLDTMKVEYMLDTMLYIQKICQILCRI